MPYKRIIERASISPKNETKRLDEVSRAGEAYRKVLNVSKFTLFYAKGEEMMSKRLRYGKTLTLIFLAASMYVAPFLIGMVYAPTTWVSLDPKVIIDTTLVPGSTFVVNIIISGVTDLHSWEVELDFNKEFLNTTLNQIQEGPFLENVGATSFRKEIIDPYGVLINSTLGSGGADGNGVLASVTFVVKQRGYTTMSFSYITLKNSVGNDIQFDSEWEYGFRNVENMYIEPLTSVANPSETFSLGVKVANVTNVYGWQFQLDWKVGVMTFAGATEGDFLKGPGIGTFFAQPYVTPSSAFVGATRLGPVSGASGSGVLATISLNVENTGACTLALSDTKLINNTAGLTAHTTQDGYFHTTRPACAFEFLPLYPSVSEATTFNATASYDPDGGSIVSYTWDFGDGTGEVTETDPFTTHTFSEYKVYTVSLNVTDDEGEWWNTQKYAAIVKRDVAVTDVKASHSTVIAGTIVFVNATLSNKGDIQEQFNIAAYYNTSLIGTKSVTLGASMKKTVTFEWNTTSVPMGTYTLKAVADTLPYETNTTNNEFINGEIIVSLINRIERKVEIGGVAFHYVIESNSSIANPVFSGQSKEISFDATVPDGQVGFSNVTIPMRLLNASSPNAWTVELDGNSIPYSTSNNDTHYTIYFTYTVGSHKIQVIGTSAAIEPVASFTVKATAYTHETIAFNATASNDPDGTIVAYYWIFGDGSTANETDSTTTHIYTVGGKTYNVTLWVTDNSGFKKGTWKQLSVSWLINLAVVDVHFSPTAVTWGDDVSINVTVTNEGDLAATFNVTVNSDSLVVGKLTVTNLAPGATTELHFVWNTTSAVAGTYNITGVAEQLPGEVDISDNSLIGGQVTVGKLGSSISVSASLVTFNIGDSTVLSGVITPRRALIKVGINYRLTGATWQRLTMASTSEEGTYTYSWRPATAGTYEIKVEWFGDSTTQKSESSILTITVNKIISTLSIELSASSITLGASVNIGGTLLPVRVGAGVTIQSRLSGGEWSEITTATTNENGQYAYVWNPPQSGTYDLKATWQGDPNTKSAESEIKSVTVQSQFSDVILYAAVVVIAVAVAVGVYMWKFRKPKEGKSNQ
jgi:hypothetical protein